MNSQSSIIEDEFVRKQLSPSGPQTNKTTSRRNLKVMKSLQYAEAFGEKTVMSKRINAPSFTMAKCRNFNKILLKNSNNMHMGTDILGLDSPGVGIYKS